MNGLDLRVDRNTDFFLKQLLVGTLGQATCCQVQDLTVTWPWGSCFWRAWLVLDLAFPFPCLGRPSHCSARIFTSSLSFCFSQAHFLLWVLFVLALLFLFLETESFCVDQVGL